MTSAQAPLPALSIRLPILSVLSVLSFSPLPRLAPFSARRHASICQVLLSLAAADVPPGSDGRTDSQTYEISYPAPSSGFPFSILVYFPASFPFVPLFLPLSLSLFLVLVLSYVHSTLILGERRRLSYQPSFHFALHRPSFFSPEPAYEAKNSILRYRVARKSAPLAVHTPRYENFYFRLGPDVSDL